MKHMSILLVYVFKKSIEDITINVECYNDEAKRKLAFPKFTISVKLSDSVRQMRKCVEAYIKLISVASHTEITGLMRMRLKDQTRWTLDDEHRTVQSYGLTDGSTVQCALFDPKSKQEYTALPKLIINFGQPHLF